MSVIGRLDYDIIDGLYERKDEIHRFIPDFCRLKIFTERMQKFLEEKTGKEVPLFSVIELTKEELGEVRKYIKEEKKFIGLYGAYLADHFATEEELHYDYKWSDL